MDERIQESNPSADSAQVSDVVEDNPSAANPDPASSTGSDEGVMDLLSVVRNAAPDEDDTASPADQQSSDPTEQAGEQKPEHPSEDEAKVEASKDADDFSDVPFNKHPRFQRLVRERNAYRQDAQQYQQVQTFLAENGITPEEAADQLTLLAEMKTNPQAAWAKLKPMVQKVLIEAGEALPEDLTAKVRAKQLSPEQALEISRLRAKDAARDRQEEQRVQLDESRRQREAQAAVRNTVAEWEQSARDKDPDFDRKADALRGRILVIHQTEGPARTPEKALDQVQRAYSAVNEQFAAFRPKKPAVQPIEAGRTPNGSPSNAPKSMLDIVRDVQAAG